MTPSDDSWDEERLAALLASATGDSPPPDEEFIARLGEQSTEVFAAQSPAPPQPRQRRSRMLVMAWRVASAAMAAAVLVAAWLWSSISTQDSSVALGKALDNFAQTRTLHLSVTLAGQPAEVWATRAGLLRWNNPDGTYRIARGAKLWLVDEKANRAASQACALFRPDKAGLDALALLDVPEPGDRETLLRSRPLKRVRSGDLDCDLYRVEIVVPHGKMQLEALVDPATQLLRSLETRVDRDGKVEPAAKLTVLAVDQPVPEELFVVGDTLTEDGRIGKVTDAQGIVMVKPVMAQRWTPVSDGLLLKPGDWLQTDLRGANAVAVRLVKQTGVTLGPGALVELVKPGQIRIFSGDVKIAAGDEATVEVLGPGQQKIAVQGTAVYRIEQEKLVRLEREPLWLKGFEGSVVNESIGSLVATVEGRNVPLTVGYHKVTVEIRDQIARTVIEESFVNHTAGRLEGVFHFPLPQDASISGFGMWIGDNLVEADVVEKQRAREIYEEILRAQRDPGLLEWTGGNIFKARVFPIEARSEKRIKLTYTQVLPRRGNSYRYSYALQSEMLKQHPLRELAIDVKINSVVPLANVSCPTHMTRGDHTRHSAHVEFTAQEYTPARDFEVVVEVDGRRPSPPAPLPEGEGSVVLIPHRRGEDGYFMLLVTPPSSGMDAQREILPEGQPLELLVLADTSASLDSAARAAQAEFIAALLGSLTPRDTLNVACCDVECDWVFQKSQPAEAKHVAAARQFLADRVSLGWTDLDKVFAAVLERCGPKTRVVYVGDGIPTTGDADPVAFAKRLRRLYEGKHGTFYAVSVGSSFESGVLKTIASLGGGSMRQISGEHGPRAVALELLGEFARPALRDLKVQFRGLRTARVYPEELPNVPAGSQQIILGRYLPEGRDQSGEVVVTGIQGDKPVRFTARVSLRDAEQGNSFIPRLWARMHLDSLLQQEAEKGTVPICRNGPEGAAHKWGLSPFPPPQAIQDEIIALSEEYHIITPYTSLLVLESDADRERFGVKRRFLMRDGEKFFAQGRENAEYELVQQQMKRAGNWRLGLRRAVLRQLMALGRDPQVFQGQRSYHDRVRRLPLLSKIPYVNEGDAVTNTGAMPGLGGPAWEYDANGESHALFLGDASRLDEFSERSSYEHDKRLSLDEKGPVHEIEAGDPLAETPMEPSTKSDPRDMPPPDSGAVTEDLISLAKAKSPDKDLFEPEGEPASASNRLSRLSVASTLTVPYDSRFRWTERGQSTQSTRWLDQLFPAVPAPPAKEEELRQRWPAEARALAESLLRTAQLAQLKGGLEIDRRAENFDARWGDLSSRWRILSLVSPAAWLVRSDWDNSQSTIQWCDGRQRGILGTAFQLGRLRASTPRDLSQPPLDLSGHVLSSLERGNPQHTVELRPHVDGQTLLVLKHPTSPAYETHVLIDTRRHVILSIEQRSEGKITSTTKFGAFVEAAGCWWAGRIESFSDNGRRLSVITQQFKAIATEALQQRMTQELASRDQVQSLREPAVFVEDAKRAVATGKATFDDQITLAAHFARSQQWVRVMAHLEAAEQLAVGKPGMRWVRNAVLNVSRRREELKQRILAEAAEIAKSQTGTPAKPQAEAWFLADHLLNQSSGHLEGNEMLALLDVLLPVYQRQPAYLPAMPRWQEQRARYLQNVGRADEALQLRRQMAEAYPRDYQAQQQYAQMLASAGEHEAAYAWLRRALSSGVAWLPHEEESLRNTYVELMYSEGRFGDLVGYLDDWIKRNPERSATYQQYLGTLVRMNRLEEANRLIAQWLKEGPVAGRLPPPVAARLDAAVNQALGQGYNLYTNRVDERWLKPLAETVLFFGRHEFQSWTAERIMQQWQFRQSDECRRVRKTVLGILLTESGRLPPEQVRRFVTWIAPNDPAIEPAVWKQLAAALQKRWSAEPKPEIKHQLAQPLVEVLSYVGTAERLAFLRLQVQQGPKEYRAQYVQQLFDAVLGQPWSQEYEDEAFALLPGLSDSQDAIQKLLVQVAAVHRLTDRMVPARFDALMRTIEHPEKLPRPGLLGKRAENLRLAREGFAARLGRELPKYPGPLAPWLNIERLYLDVLLGRNLPKVAEECWEIVGPQPCKLAATNDRQQWVDEVLRNRCLLTLCNLAVRKDAEPTLIERLLKYVDQGLALDAEDLRWRLLKYQLLVALDRPKDLEQTLQGWVRTDGPVNRWRLSLAYLLAEQGRISEAIKLFEAVAADDELGPLEYRTLADWYLVVNRRAEHQRAMISAYKTQEEYRLSNRLSAMLRPWQRHDGKMPTELDKDVLLILAALFEKSSSPQSYLWQLQQFYQATRDFRLLSGLADAVMGHTAGYVYPFLQGMRPVLGEVGDEATVDSIVEYLAKVRAEKGTVPISRNGPEGAAQKWGLSPFPALDQRALDLLELLAERRAAELQNQPGPHAERALTAMQRAFKRQWSAGEKRLMADFLEHLARIGYAKLAQEQVRQLQALHQDEVKGSFDRLHIAWRLALTLRCYSRVKEASDLLEAALDEFQNASNGVLPTSANSALDTLIDLLESQVHHARGEKFLLEQIKHPAHEQQKYWLVQRLYQLYNSAIRNNGDVSLGSGAALYRAVEKKLIGDLSTPNHNHRAALVESLCTIYRTAHDKKFDGVADHVRAFAFQRFPEVLKRQTTQYSSLVGRVADTLHDLAGARDGLAFLIERIEQEPVWLRYNNDDGWGRHAHRLNDWRLQVKQLGDLEPRLLRIVLSELRRDLQSGQSRNRAIYHRHHHQYWTEKENEFVRVAEEVYADRKQSGAAVAYIADYLYSGVSRHDRAIEILLIAYRDRLLEEPAQSQLVRFLHERSRYGESIAILQAMIERWPENIQYRVWLMHAYFHTHRPAELLGILQQTDEYFHQKGRWSEAPMAALAQGCLDTQLYEQSAKYYQELIPLHQRTHARRGIGNGTLSAYYSQMAQAYAGLKKTAEAVDAACGAIVSWGPRHERRADALAALKRVLSEVPNLDAYVAVLDKQCAETRLQNPLVRKSLGQVYLDKQQYARAIVQLQLACQLQPNDTETHQALVACYDKQSDQEGAVRQVLQSLQLSRRDIKLYEDLGRRLAALGRAKEQERAYTAIVEVLPSESESHALLAEIREKENRWGEAIGQWQQVARIRALEPTGLLRLAAAQIHQKQWREAAETVGRLRVRSWPTRFGNVVEQVRQLEGQIERGRDR